MEGYSKFGYETMKLNASKQGTAAKKHNTKGINRQILD